MLSVVLLCWAVLQLYAPSTCHPLQEAPSAAEAMPGRSEESTKSTYFMKRNYNDNQRRTLQGSQGIFSYLNPTKGCSSVLNVKRNKFICLDSKRNVYYTSVDDAKEDCRFQHVKRYKYYNVFCSCRSNVVLILHQSKAKTSNSSTLSRILFVKRHTNRRKRRSWHTDPSDPLGSEYPVMRAISNQRKDPQYVNNISKETIALVDDPLQVLLSHSPLSPTLEKNRKNKKFRF